MVNTSVAANPARKILAVIVTYRPDSRKIKALCRRLQEQVSHTLVVDNTPGDSATLAGLASDLVSVHRLGCNHGIAAAQNIGVQWGRTQGYTHILFLDQDSMPAWDMVAQLGAAEDRLIADGVRVAAVGPQAFSRLSGEREPFLLLTGRRLRKWVCPEEGMDVCEVSYLHASGSLTRIELFTGIGALADELFIDLVDIEWSLRAGYQGYQSVAVCAAHIEHQVGEKEQIGWGRPARTISVHPPERLYYQVRNCLLLYKKPFVPRWFLCWYLTRYVLGPFLLRLVFLPQRGKRCCCFWHGLWHGLTGRSGPYAEQDR